MKRLLTIKSTITPILTLMLMLILTACGCGVSQEEYDRVLEELERVQDSSSPNNASIDVHSDTPSEQLESAPILESPPLSVNLDLPIITKDIVVSRNLRISAEGILQCVYRYYDGPVLIVDIDTDVRTIVPIIIGMREIPTLSPETPSIANALGIDMYIKNDNSLWGCGSGRYGRLGDGTGLDHDTPVKIMDDVAVAWFFDDSLDKLLADSQDEGYRAIKTDKTVWQWGDGVNYEPVQIASDAISVRDGVVHKSSGLLLKLSDGLPISPGIPVNQYTGNGGLQNPGRIWIWQESSYALCWIDKDKVLWRDAREDKMYPSNPIKLSEDVTRYIAFDQVGTPASFLFIIKADGSLWGFGNNTAGQLGDGTKAPRWDEPVKI